MQQTRITLPLLCMIICNIRNHKVIPVDLQNIIFAYICQLELYERYNRCILRRIPTAKKNFPVHLVFRNHLRGILDIIAPMSRGHHSFIHMVENKAYYFHVYKKRNVKKYFYDKSVWVTWKQGNICTWTRCTHCSKSICAFLEQVPSTNHRYRLDHAAVTRCPYCHEWVMVLPQVMHKTCREHMIWNPIYETRVRIDLRRIETLRSSIDDQDWPRAIPWPFPHNM